MKRSQFEKINDLLNQLLINEQPVLFSGQSLNIIINHFSEELKKERWNRSKKDLDKLLKYWENNIQKFKDNLFKSARDADSFTQFNGQRTIMVREDDAIKSTNLCPPGPKELLD